MRSRIVGAGVGVLLLGLVSAACSDDPSEPFDAGLLPDSDFTTEPDAGDAAVSVTPDATVSDDAGPGSDGAADAADHDAPETPDSSQGPDAADASSTRDASDAASAGDASDASVPRDANDASVPPDASDASVPPDAGDASAAPDANDASTPEASDASSEDASDDAPADASESPDAMSVCTGYVASTDPIAAVVATDNGQTVSQSSTGTASASYPVLFVATTSPAGLAQLVQLGYCTGSNGCASPTYVTMTLDAGAGAASDVWTAQIPAFTAGTTVYWWVQAQDTCGTGQEHYWSNFGHNFPYTTQ